MKQLLDLKPGQECILLGWFLTPKKRVRWDGETTLPEGCVNTLYILTDLDTGEEIKSMAESWIEEIK
jgi:hypothetical protein